MLLTAARLSFYVCYIILHISSSIFFVYFRLENVGALVKCIMRGEAEVEEESNNTDTQSQVHTV